MLLVRYGKRGRPFHPKMWMSRTSGFCHNQWTVLWGAQPGRIGFKCPGLGLSIEQLVTEYLTDLKKHGHFQVEQS